MSGNYLLDARFLLICYQYPYPVIKHLFFIFSDNPLYCSCELFQWITQDFVSKNCHNQLKGQNPKKYIHCFGKNNQTKHNILKEDLCPTYIQVKNPSKFLVIFCYLNIKKSRANNYAVTNHVGLLIVH